jgi:hypothetical protein
VVANLAVVVAPAAASGGEGLPIYSESLSFPPIDSVAAPGEYSWRVELGAGETLTQVSPTEAEIARPPVWEAVHAPLAYDAHGTPVPTTLAVSDGDVITLTVHHREGAFVYPVSTKTPEELDTAEIQDSQGFGRIAGPEAPERYPFRVELGEEQELRQVSETEVLVVSGGEPSLSIHAEDASDAEGATVPTTLKLNSEDIVTLIVHYRAGNPAAGGAPFHYPITAGKGWSGGFRTIVVPMTNPLGEPQQPTTTTYCRVPSLRDLSLRAAKTRLRAAHCAIGEVHLATGATAGKGKVVKQFRAAGTELAAGAPVAVKLGSR